MPSPLTSIVVPVYNEEETLPALYDRTQVALADLPGSYELIFVDDGSSDRSVELIEGWARERDDVVLVQLSRNFGMEIAMSAGLDHSRGDHVVLMHADLQDPPELIPDMLRAARDEGADVVFARRIGRDESRTKRLLATGFYTAMRKLARVPYQGQAGDFRLMSRRVADTRPLDAGAAALPARDGGLGGLQAGADRIPAGRARGRRWRVLPGAVPARPRGAHVVLRRAAEPGDLCGRAHRHAERRRGAHVLVLAVLGAVTASTASGSWSRSSSSAESS